jgi:hypothetical protein
MHELLLADVPNEVIAGCEAIVAASVVIGGVFGVKSWLKKRDDRIRQEGAKQEQKQQLAKIEQERLARFEAAATLVGKMDEKLHDQDGRMRDTIKQAVTDSVAAEVSKVTDSMALQIEALDGRDRDYKAIQASVSRIDTNVEELKQSFGEHREDDKREFAEVRELIKKSA